MKNTKRKLLATAALGLGAVLLSGCTANFCSISDRSEMLYPYEQGVTVYCSEAELTEYKKGEGYTSLDAKHKGIFDSLAGPAISGNTNVYKYVPFSVGEDFVTFKAAKASQVNSIISASYTNGYRLPSIQFWAAMDQKVLDAAVKAVKDEKGVTASALTLNDTTNGTWCVNPYKESDTDGTSATAIPLDVTTSGVGNSILRYYGDLKFAGFYEANFKTESNYYQWVSEFRTSSEPGLGLDGTPNNDFVLNYHDSLVRIISAKKSCITTRTDTYGHYGAKSDWEVAISQKDWGYAWGRGFFEGLLVFPIAWMVDTFAYSFDPALSGVGQIFAIILVALIVRVFMALVTLRSQISQQKMQALQPQLAKIQAKYPNANTNQAEKMRLSQETQALYKRNGVSMFAPFLTLIIQFPLFICVWDAMNGSAALSSGAVLNLRLSDSIQSVLFNVSGAWYANENGWWTALGLYLIMAAAQILAVLIPRLIQKKSQKKVAQMYRNANAESQQKTGKFMMYALVGITLVTGFFLPSAMGVYWFIGAIISMTQTLITQAVIERSRKKKAGAK